LRYGPDHKILGVKVNNGISKNSTSNESKNNMDNVQKADSDKTKLKDESNADIGKNTVSVVETVINNNTSNAVVENNSSTLKLSLKLNIGKKKI
jgi:hypothetical protein